MGLMRLAAAILSAIKSWEIIAVIYLSNILTECFVYLETGTILKDKTEIRLLFLLSHTNILA